MSVEKDKRFSDEEQRALLAGMAGEAILRELEELAFDELDRITGHVGLEPKDGEYDAIDMRRLGMSSLDMTRHDPWVHHSAH